MSGETELEFFPGVMRPASHVHAGITIANKNKFDLYIVVSEEWTETDQAWVEQLLDSKADTLGQFARCSVIRFPMHTSELPIQVSKLLDMCENKYRWFSWRVMAK